MHPELRARFNSDFSPEKYAGLLRCVNETEKWPADFRISETPIFLTREFCDEVVGAANEIVAKTRTAKFARHAATAIPSGLEVPNEPAHPNFLVVDFGICTVGNRLVPRLIELQAFPSLFGFQLLLLGCMRKAFPAIPRDWTSSFGGIDDDDYLKLLRRTMLGDSRPENVVLLEIDPAKSEDTGRFRLHRITSRYSARLASPILRNVDGNCSIKRAGAKCGLNASIIA